jgi:hypothetical protein
VRSRNVATETVATVATVAECICKRSICASGIECSRWRNLRFGASGRTTQLYGLGSSARWHPTSSVRAIPHYPLWSSHPTRTTFCAMRFISQSPANAERLDGDNVLSVVLSVPSARTHPLERFGIASVSSCPQNAMRPNAMRPKQKVAL